MSNQDHGDGARGKAEDGVPLLVIEDEQSRPQDHHFDLLWFSLAQHWWYHGLILDGLFQH